MHVEGVRVFIAVAATDGQQVRSVRHRGRQKDDELCVRRADHRHQVRLAPDLRRLRAEARTLNRERLVRAVDGSAQHHQLLRAGSVALLALGVREVGSQNHHQKSRQQYSSGKTHKASRDDG